MNGVFNTALSGIAGNPSDWRNRIWCYFGYHKWRFTGILKCCGLFHHARCDNCGEEDWFDDLAYLRMKLPTLSEVRPEPNNHTKWKESNDKRMARK
jgi:hypothetical protein